MTMICIACKGDHAEVMTDSVGYTANTSLFARCSKLVALSHLDAAVIVHGDADFGATTMVAALSASMEATSFDDLADLMPGLLRELWQDMNAHREVGDFTAYVVGYSPEREKFTATVMSNIGDFRPSRINKILVTPSPLDQRPHRDELTRMHRDLDGMAAAFSMDEAEVAQSREAIERWALQGPPTVPHTTEDWIALAEQVREQRALGHWMWVPVAGDVFLTQLGRGELTTRKVHTFNDSGEEFLRMVAHTDHPLGQLIPCWCESGKMWLDCHKAPFLDEPCGCASGETFRNCCMVAAAEHATA